MRGRYWLMSVAIAATTMATTSGATEERSSLETCGHYDELAAAKRALEEGDKTSALVHLRNADALLARCEREAERAHQPADEPADETVVGGAEAPPTPRG
jgi:hypothetical protein